jgi:[ribosomal protein S5]-alanine N-acetyltransferase
MIETRRAILRPFEMTDAEAAFSWFGDTEVMRFISSGPDRSPAQTRTRIESYREHQDGFGYSKWIVLEKWSGRPIGDSGLIHVKGSTEIELGYRISKSHWGEGLATEVAEAWLTYGFEKLGLDRIIAFAHPDHRASIRVMEKVGMHFDRPDRIYGVECLVYARQSDPAKARQVIPL